MVYTLNESTGKTRPQKTYATARTRIRGQYGWHTQTPTQRVNTIRYIRARKAEIDALRNEAKKPRFICIAMPEKMFFLIQCVYRYFQPSSQRRVGPGLDGESPTNPEGH